MGWFSVTTCIVVVLSIVAYYALDRWRASKIVWLKSTPVPILSDFSGETADIWAENKPVVLKGFMKHWKAVKSWEDLDHVKEAMKNDNKGLRVHLPLSDGVQMMSMVQPFGEEAKDVKWKRPWREDILSGDRLTEFFDMTNFSKRKRQYVMIPGDDIPTSMVKEVGGITSLHPAWVPEREVNLWMATAPVHTPLHFDLTHNMYVQIRSQKRFTLFHPSNGSKVHIYPRLHPSSRQSQMKFFYHPNETDKIGFDARNFPGLSDMNANKLLKPMHVTLEPGDVLFIPGFYLHHVSALEQDMSMSLSVSFGTNDIKTREQLHDLLPPNLSEDYYLEDVIAALTLYVVNIVPAERDPVAYIQELFQQRYEPLKYDDAAEGLWAWLTSGSNIDVDTMISAVQNSAELSKQDMTNWIHKARDARYRASTFTTSSVRDLELGSFIEDVISLVLGPGRVFPFLQNFKEIVGATEEMTKRLAQK